MLSCPGRPGPGPGPGTGLWICCSPASLKQTRHREGPSPPRRGAAWRGGCEKTRRNRRHFSGIRNHGGKLDNAAHQPRPFPSFLHPKKTTPKLQPTESPRPAHPITSAGTSLARLLARPAPVGVPCRCSKPRLDTTMQMQRHSQAARCPPVSPWPSPPLLLTTLRMAWTSPSPTRPNPIWSVGLLSVGIQDPQPATTHTCAPRLCSGVADCATRVSAGGLSSLAILGLLEVSEQTGPRCLPRRPVLSVPKDHHRTQDHNARASARLVNSVVCL